MEEETDKRGGNCDKYIGILAKQSESLGGLNPIAGIVPKRWVFFLDFLFCDAALPKSFPAGNLLVEGLGVGGSAGDVGVTGGLVGAGGELELCRNIRDIC
jgi:hypothetical protein